MEIRVLRYFIAVANEESISAAAKQLHLSQPTLSRQLKDLEMELGTDLFIRGNRKISLTEEGKYLLKKAKEIVDLADKTEANLKDSKEMVSGEVYIGAGETEAMHLIAKTLKVLIKDYPNIRFHLYSGNADDIKSKLDSGLLDFGVVIEPTDKQKYEYAQLPAKDTWGVLMCKDSPLSDKQVISPVDLINKPLFISRQATVSNELTGWFGQSIDNLNIVATYNLLYNAALMVEEGIGYALCIDKIINTSGNSKLCFKPLQPKLEANLNIIWKKNQVFSNAAHTFINQLRNSMN
ncbi:LysR family transcriptional regulator [Bacillus wiedmannii]|uniref:HTH-type transcriptional regulator CzcR n=2 Tax=Bacillus cereus group TaxID=86661 RepID=A0A1C4ERV8_BACTU|nr:MULTISPECIES: LysR family transcriptional regulator [Bacillus]MCC2326880.1 LysR family transcriptional regulator [Bacillus wiedmannii]MED3025568.1 LysR family transcriptional regulator [Bacillus wiedmannii]OTX98780.1 LysR family transcriptional regulator [Bacillus thuringiensis serovar wratislaviensis]OUB58217.1 LysR family transcriptional regulator [Bacillus thuringiensis serovar sylvestriensis]PEJ80781.1 LysR family transcriptional regulator [Bacillus wiedmannii]